MRGSTIVPLFVAMYFAAATVAFIRTGIIADIFRGPPGGYLRGVSASGRLAMAIPAVATPCVTIFSAASTSTRPFSSDSNC